MEIWLRSPLGPAHVEVSNLGNIRTLDRLAPSVRERQPTQLRAGRLLSPWVTQQGYLCVSIKEGSGRTKYLVHRLVASAFCPGFNALLAVNHIDGNKLNNNPGNLEWVTKERNTALAWETGQCKPEFHATKLNPQIVAAIKARIRGGESCRSLARHYGVSATLLYKIRDGERWSSVA